MFSPTNLPRSVDKHCMKNVPAPQFKKPIYTHTNRKEIQLPLTEAQLKEILMRFDTNKDGLLSKEELKNAFNSLGALFPRWRANQALYHADRNGDGFISKDELDEVVKYAKRYGYTIK